MPFQVPTKQKRHEEEVSVTNLLPLNEVNGSDGGPKSHFSSFVSFSFEAPSSPTPINNSICFHKNIKIKILLPVTFLWALFPSIILLDIFVLLLSTDLKLFISSERVKDGEKVNWYIFCHHHCCFFSSHSEFAVNLHIMFDPLWHTFLHVVRYLATNIDNSLWNMWFQYKVKNTEVPKCKDSHNKNKKKPTVIETISLFCNPSCEIIKQIKPIFNGPRFLNPQHIIKRCNWNINWDTNLVYIERRRDNSNGWRRNIVFSLSVPVFGVYACAGPTDHGPRRMVV